MVARLKEKYENEVRPALMKEFNYHSVMEVPRLTKVVVNIGLGEALQNAKALDAAVGDITTITGQHPQVRRARKSIATFKLRAPPREIPPIGNIEFIIIHQGTGKVSIDEKLLNFF